MANRKFSIVFLSTLMLLGCGGEPANTSQPTTKISSKFVSAKSSDNKVAFVLGIEQKMTEFEERLDDLEERAESARQDVKGNLFLQISGLRSKLGQFKGELYVYGNRIDTGREARRKLEQSWQSLLRDYAVVSADFDANI